MIEQKPVAIVGIGAILPGAHHPEAFWQNLKDGFYAIQDVPADRWLSDLYYDPDRKAIDKTYSKIGGFVSNFQLNPIKLRIPIPPTVLAQMDQTQQWAIAASHQALSDYGYPETRSLDPERVAVILGNAMAGEKHYLSTMRIRLPDYLQALSSTDAFRNLPAAVQQELINGMQANVWEKIAEITEDTMPGELSNIIAGRVANVFNFSGPNFVTDAACASSLAAMEAAMNGLNAYHFDAVLTGGVDRNMGVESYVKFSKIGALSPDGSRPYADGANGFVMGEGAAVFLVKRLADAERDGDQIYAVIRSIGSSSDGKGKGITAPNPLGQQRAIERAWQQAGISPASTGLIEGHGTSTKVGDVVEVNSLNAIFGKVGLQQGAIALGSVKSNIGHLKSAAGAAGVLKAAYALHEKILPPSVNFHKPNPNIDWMQIPFAVNTQLRTWERPAAEIRRAGVSSFGFGGTNFHVVMEEYLPGMHSERFTSYPAAAASTKVDANATSFVETPVIANNTENQPQIEAYVLQAVSEKTGYPVEMLDLDLDLEADLGIDTVKQAELFASIREHYGIPRREDLRLSEYNTLAKVIGFVQDNRVETAAVNPAASVQQIEPDGQTVQSPAQSDAVKTFVLEKVAEKTGYPVEMLDLDLDLEADLGIDTVKQAELFASIREHYGIPRREDLRLSDYNTLAKVIGFFDVNDNQAGNMEAEDLTSTSNEPSPADTAVNTHFRGLFFSGADTAAELKKKLVQALESARKGELLLSGMPSKDEIRKAERLAIDFGDTDEFIKRAEKTLKALEAENPSMWQALTAQGVYRGSGKAGKVAFLFPGQGSQYVNMLRELREIEKVVDETFYEADRTMTPLLGKPLTDYIYADGDEASLKAAEAELKNTEITQPAVLTANVALLRLMQQYGFSPDVVVGHSLGEYAALVAAGVLTFPEALEVVSARGREMSKVSMEDNGCMAAVSAPLAEVERILKTIDGYVVIANINSPTQSVIAGATTAVEKAIEAFKTADYQAVKIPVSHAFHTKIVAPASEPLRAVIERMNIQPPQIPVAANVTGDWYPNDRAAIVDMLAAQVASPVQFIQDIEKLYETGARIFVEIGPKRVLNALSSDILKEKSDISLVASNHPRKGALPSFNEALCALLAAGIVPQQVTEDAVDETAAPVQEPAQTAVLNGRLPLTGSVVISGAGLGLPGKNGQVFAEDNIERLLSGDVRIETFSNEIRQEMVRRRAVRLVKSEAGAVMQEIEDLSETVKLAGQRGKFDLVQEFGVPEDRVEATDIATQLAIAAGIDALHDAGIPLVMNYRTTSKGTLLPDRWMLPNALRDETGVVFASAFPGMDRMAEETERFYNYSGLKKQVDDLKQIKEMLNGSSPEASQAISERIQRLEAEIQANDYHFDRRFIFRILAMGHSQFAEYVGARGPNTYVNAACATTTHAVAIAEDWIRAGRCRRVIVVAGDDVSGGSLVDWISTGLMASGAATTEGNVRQAAVPFDRRRNGMIMGMGAAALVVEAEDAIRERGMRGICELLGSQIANSAFHGTRLDVAHVSQIMDRLISQAEARFGIKRAEIAPQTVFVSHETYTPARGGSAAAEIRALRETFGNQANQVVIANTKGFTGHTMGVGVEDVIAVKALEKQVVPPIAHYDQDFEPDPDLGDLNLSRGGNYPVQYALRLGAGFGSQIAMTLMRRIESQGERVNQPVYRQWLQAVSGSPEAALETVQHTLRVTHAGPPKLQPAASNWQYGQGPTAWASEPPLEKPIERKAVVIQKPEPAVTTSSTVSTINPANDDAIAAVVLAKVSEKTGYPTEMLDLGLDLEADLGIDTVKQAELFASIREHYGIPRREDLRLADYNTLAKVIGFVKDAGSENTGLENNKALSTEISATRAAGAAEQEVQAYVLKAVSEKTGYPTEMLDLDLDLEADLGIDTVKQAELFASIREHYGIPRREDLRLADYNTLAKVVGFVMEASHETKAATEETELVAEVQHLEAADAKPGVQRRLPVAVLRPRLDLCKPSGIYLQGKRVVVMRDPGKVSNTLVRRLKSAGAEVLSISANEADSIAEWQKEAPVDGLYFLSALKSDAKLASLDLESWQQQLETGFYSLVNAARVLPDLSFLVVASQMDGLHGLSGEMQANPLAGAAIGFVKALQREHEQLYVKAVDFEPATKPAQMAARLVNETLADPAAVEIGWKDDQRFTIVLQEDNAGSDGGTSLTKGSVFLVSGGSGGITAPIVHDLAAQTKGHFYLLGRSALIQRDDSDLELIHEDEARLKTIFRQRLAEQGLKVTPAMVNQEIASLQKAAATWQTVAEIEALGGKASYLRCDVNDPNAVETVVTGILEKERRIDVLIHAAGLERSRRFDAKADEEFRQVFTAKANGFFYLFKALEAHEQLPKTMLAFTSVAGRFGNAGQTDYSAANDLLTRMVSSINQQYPDIQAIALDWGAWAEVGMASRGYIPELMERAGIEMMDPREAARCVYREISRGTEGEVVLSGSLGLLEKQRDLDGGLDVEKANQALTAGNPIHVMLSRASGFSLKEGILLEAELNPDDEPFLKDHAMNGIPLLPGVMGIEGFSVAARHVASVLGSEKGGFRVEKLEDIQFLTPFKFYREEPRRITWKAQVIHEPGGLVARVTLESTMTRHHGRVDVLQHFAGKVHLVSEKQPRQSVSSEKPHWNGNYTVSAEDIYRLFFHGPSFQVLEGVQRDGDHILGRLNKALPPITRSGEGLISVPVLVELCLQTAGIWEIGTSGVLSLPQAIGALRLYENRINGVPIFAEVTPGKTETGEVCFNARVVDANGQIYLEIEDYRTSQLPYGIEKELLAPIEMLIRSK